MRCRRSCRRPRTPASVARARLPAGYARWTCLRSGLQPSSSLSTVVRACSPSAVSAPSVVPDEVVYSDLAKSIAAGGFPSVRGVHELGWGVVYQSLIAPAWVVFDDPVHAYHAALIVNALLMSLAAVPAYFLARMFVSERASVVVAAATVLVPSMSYTGLVLTENACYPAFRPGRAPHRTGAALAVAREPGGRTPRARARLPDADPGHRAGRRLPGRRRDVRRDPAARAVAGRICDGSSRPRPRRSSCRSCRCSCRSPVATALFGWLGARSSTFDDFHPAEVPQWFVFLIAGLVLYVAVIPVAATAVLCGLGLRARQPRSACDCSPLWPCRR